MTYSCQADRIAGVSQDPRGGFGAQTRQRNLQQLRTETFDLLVIGGGINGAGIARDAAMRGLRVALVEKGDFASGTSSKSSKLIHGGVRYLQQRDFRLVRVACRERDLLRRRLAPHLVEPLSFIFPVFRGDPVGLFTLGAGMWLYDLLAIFRNIRAHRMLTAKRTLKMEPSLRREGLRGAALYYDCWTDDARLTLETILAAHQEGAAVTNYMELNAFIKENGRIVGARVHDRYTGAAPFEVRARCVVNATGPWADSVRRLDDPTVKPCLRLTKGAHIIVPRARLGIVHAVVMHSPRDRRIMFAIPWGNHTLIGTTDTDFDGSLDDVRPTAEDFDYLLEAANWSFPGARLEASDIVGSYAGVRPLVANDAEDPSAVSREEEIFESASGLVTLAGGKLTTYRQVAEEIVDLVIERLRPSSSVPCPTRSKPLPGGMVGDPEEIMREIISMDGSGLTVDEVRRLVRRYGSRAPEVIGLIRSDDDLRKTLVPGLPDTRAEAAYAARAEMAIQPDDILMRRTHVGVKDPADSPQAVDLLNRFIHRADSSTD